MNPMAPEKMSKNAAIRCWVMLSALARIPPMSAKTAWKRERAELNIPLKMLRIEAKKLWMAPVNPV